MVRTESGLASNRKTTGVFPTQHLWGENSMNTSDQIRVKTELLRILVPISAKEDSRWGIQYALRRHHEGTPLEVILLNVGESITQWQVLRFRTQQEITQFQSERAQAFIEEATEFLTKENIPCRGIFKQGDIVFSILDTAEELDCDEIVMPTPKKWAGSFITRDIALDVQLRQRGVPVVFVDNKGAVF